MTIRTSLTEALSREDRLEIKDIIKAQLLSLFYKLYIKKSFWG
jgi:uncharacterized protein YbcI